MPHLIASTPVRRLSCAIAAVAGIDVDIDLAQRWWATGTT